MERWSKRNKGGKGSKGSRGNRWNNGNKGNNDANVWEHYFLNFVKANYTTVKLICFYASAEYFTYKF